METLDTIIVKHGTDSEDDVSDLGDASDNGVSFESGAKLPDASVQRHRLDHLMTLVDGPYMDLNPEYQREVVWSAERMTGLVNSIIENYYVPPVIFNCVRVPAVNGSGERWKRVCVDGKQRISSIQSFMQGKIPCYDKNRTKWYFCAPPGSTSARRRILPDNVREAFKRKELISFEFADLSRAQEEDLFARVQLGVTLNPAEKMRATTGPWQDFARMFEDDFRPIMKLLRTESRSTGFRQYLNCFSQILEVQHPTNANGIPVLKTSANAVEKFLTNHKALDDSTKSHLATVFTTFNELVLERESVFRDNGYERVKTFAPVEMVGVAVLISVYGDRRNHEMLLGDISMMRIALRRTHRDLKLNTACWKSVWEYIDTLEQFRGTAGSDFTVPKKTSNQTPGVKPVKPSSKALEPPTKTVRKAPSKIAATDRRNAQEAQDATLRTPVMDPWEPVQSLIHQKVAPRRPESPSLFVRSSSPESAGEIHSDEDMPDDPPAPNAKPFGAAINRPRPLEFTSPKTAGARQVALVAPMVAPMAPIVSRPKILASHSIKKTTLPRDPAIRSLILDEQHIQMQLSQTYDSPEEGEVIEKERQSLLAEFRTTRTPETGHRLSHSNSDNDSDPLLPRKRRAESSIVRAIRGERAHHDAMTINDASRRATMQSHKRMR